MKKITLIVLIFALPIIGFSADTWYGDDNSTKNFSSTPVIDFKPSKGVQIGYENLNSQQGFSLGAQHKAGEYIYGTSSDTTNVYINDADKTKGTVNSTINIPDNESSFSGNWSAN
ncbi:MAG: hypothetical protein JG767_58 [Deferribacteraceae bacterium]|jgi:hypothetical protein|nr:hypothetical protein [Deferribacteraceae bacterium]